MLIYAPHITQRLSYIVEFISKEFFAEPIELTTDRERFLSEELPKLNYSDERLSESEFFIRRTALLFETGVRDQNIICSTKGQHKVFFQTTGDFSFDVFAASFYLLSRYEEYLPYTPDEYGRYPHSSSLAFREGFLQLPLINLWLLEFKNSLLEKFPGLMFIRTYFKFMPTYDIDIAYAYQHKGFLRNLGGFVKAAVKGQWPAFSRRFEVLFKNKKDPHDSYEWLDSLHLYCRMRAYYFFLVAGEQKGYDKNIPRSSKAMKDLIGYHAKGYTIGIHPSWQSGESQKILQSEIKWLSDHASRKISYSRQHYIRLRLPDTFQNLLDAGIDKDFSMGYGSINGFRASVASSFFWYDLSREEKTQLMLFPFCFMDANSYYEQKLTAAQAFAELMQYYHTVKNVHGLMVTIWHNHFLGTDPQFEGWKQVYEIFLQQEVYWDM